VTLIEAVLFISVALGLIVGGLVFYQQATTAARTQELVRLTSAIISEARVVYGRDRANTAVCDDDPDFSFCPLQEQLFGPGGVVIFQNDATQVLINAGSIPAGNIVVENEGQVDESRQIVSPWNSELVPYITREADGSTSLALNVTDLPRNICTRITAVDQGGRSILGDQVIRVIFNATDRAAEAITSTISPSVAADRCRNVTSAFIFFRLS
jgi:hypothetical protein